MAEKLTDVLLECEQKLDMFISDEFYEAVYHTELLTKIEKIIENMNELRTSPAIAEAEKANL